MTEYLLAMQGGLGNLLSWPNILIPVLGTLIAMSASFLPGIGNASLSAVMLLLTLHWDTEQVLLLFGALTGGATFMGSITGILFNIPGNVSSSAALIDGYPMSRKGLARTAIATAATASAVGSVFGVVVLVAILPVVRPLILEFGPFERLLLGIWGLSTIIAIPSSGPVKALAMTLLGLLVAMIGSDPTTGGPRWTFGSLSLYDGFGTVALLLGFLTLSEVMSWRRSYQVEAVAQTPDPADSVRAGVRSVFTHIGLTLRSSVLGTLIGVIPGVGGTVAGFVAYGQAVQSAKGDRSQFGKGDIRGLIAPEAAVDSKDGGSLLPALAFGLPGSEGGVILITVFAIHGVVPGIPMLTVDLDLTFTLIMALLLSNLLTSAVGVAAAPMLARLTTLRIDRIALPVVVASLVTIVQLNGVLADLYVAVAFGLFGYLLKHFGWPRIPFIIAFVLGSFIEQNLALSSQLWQVGRLVPQQQPAAMVLIALIGLSIFWMARRVMREDTDTPAQPGEIWLPLGLAAFAGLLAGIAVLGGGYSAVAIGTALATAALFGLAALQLRGRSTAAAQAGSGLWGLPRAHVAPLGLLAGLPFAIWVTGLPVAIGGFVWLWGGAGRGRFGQILALAIALAAAGATALYLDRFAHVILPAPLLGQVIAALGG